MEFLLTKDEVSYSELIRSLEKNVAVLKVENHHNSRIGCELETKLSWFNNVSRGLTDKLDALWSLAEARCAACNEIKLFADQISNSWICINRQICENYSRIRMASRTLHGVPLALLLDKVKKEVSFMKVTLEIHETVCRREYILKGYNLIAEIEELLNKLEKCDSKLQQYLSISKITPQLIKLESAVDRYVAGVQLLSTKESISFDLSVFSIVGKLLTGELLGHEPMNPNYVLAENAPKKPVFIIKNVKRKMLLPT